MGERLTLRRRLSYNTNKNRRKAVRTPGNRLVYHYLKKKGQVPKCGNCKLRLRGIEQTRISERRRISRRRKTVNRSYGGVLCHKCVRDNIIRAFLLEETKIVTKVLKQRDVVQRTKAATGAASVAAAAAAVKSKSR